MISEQEKTYILQRAYIPEHSISLMTGVSRGEPYLIHDHFCCLKGDWLIVVGYPLAGDFEIGRLASFLEKVKERFRPRSLSLMAPELPESFRSVCRERERDEYYTLDLQKAIRPRLMRTVEKARAGLRTETAREMREAHRHLTSEFIQRVDPGPKVCELLERMPDYVRASPDARVLNAWDARENLAAYYVIDLSPETFSGYVVGCHSKKNHVAGASDLVFYEMIRISLEYGKRYVHLGLGVNRGIRQFKKKWGGEATRPYETGRIDLKRSSFFEAFLEVNRYRR